MDEQQRSLLVDAAIAARANAYAPYSGFRVGAALLAQNGAIFSGVNVENASYGLTCCAERVALFAATAVGQREFKAIAVATDGAHAPCGACRQVINELAPNATILLVDSNSAQVQSETSIDELLPHSFQWGPQSDAEQH